jgi:hypothetical protein
MSEEDTAHMRLIRRWLKGEIVNGAVGIKVTGGPFDGRIRIMWLDASGQPPALTRGRRGPSQVWHVYRFASEPDEYSSWIYVYEGTQPLGPDGMNLHNETPVP